MSFWNIWFIFRDLINSFKKTFVFFLHVTSKRFSQDSNYWSSIIRHIRNSMFLLTIQLFIVNDMLSQNVRFNFPFIFSLIIVLKGFVIFNGCWMLVRILFFTFWYFIENVFDFFVLILLIFIDDFDVSWLSLIDVSAGSYIFKVFGWNQSGIFSWNIW